ncbi:hypothetical protein [Bacillus sp. 3255]|uniref:hypothetical protein n=1 Tax=Bacillus sp. 3255 TaxID=2817904 RepID=UPI00286754C8|nr:hypothetical protein [Bacillus sp. 3255]MDR6878674.1 hypothetical protein [Bacillus sp. 3255]
MEDNAKRETKPYARPMVLSQQPVRFETAQSWNKGRGNLDHPGKGNDGINYPNPPYTGPHQGGKKK